MSQSDPELSRLHSDLTQAFADKRAEAAWTELFEHFASNSHIYASLLNGKGSAWFLDRMRQDLMDSFKRIRRTHKSIVPVEVARCFFASATIGVTYFWLKGRKGQRLLCSLLFSALDIRNLLSSRLVLCLGDREPRHLVPRSAIEQPSGRLLIETTPLLEKERSPVLPA